MIITVRLTAEYEFDTDTYPFFDGMSEEDKRGACVEWALDSLAEDVYNVSVEVEVE